MRFPERLAEDAARVGARLAAAIADLPPDPVRDAMAYAVEGGKGLRGFLVLEGARLHGLEVERALDAAAAIEALHAYSLVHDDLPAMDDDDLRRGRPTLHRRWDEAIAILAGDALQALAFELVLGEGGGAAGGSLGLSLARAAGARGMVLGQSRDIAAQARGAHSLEEITAMQAGKTGALLVWSAEAGARLAGADRAPLSRYGHALGLAFQVADDLLDLEGSEAEAGKRLGKDAAAGKATFASLLGVEGARAKARALVAEAEAALDPYGARAETLRACARYMVERRR